MTGLVSKSWTKARPLRSMVQEAPGVKPSDGLEEAPWDEKKCSRMTISSSEIARQTRGQSMHVPSFISIYCVGVSSLQPTRGMLVCLDILATKRRQDEAGVSRQADATLGSFLQLLFVVQSRALTNIQQLCLGEGSRFRCFGRINGRAPVVLYRNICLLHSRLL